MDQHPIPRQITTFEFKLIGFMTLKQFLYLVVFFPLGFIVYKLFPIPLLNILFGILTAATGLVFAFVPVQDRPIDIWLKNFYKRLTSPTQYTYHKKNEPLYFLKELYFLSDPHKVISHIESQEKLAIYLASRKQPAVQSMQKQHIQALLKQPNLNPVQTDPQTPIMQTSIVAPVQPQTPLQIVQVVQDVHQFHAPSITPNMNKQPFFVGSVRNSKKIFLPGILVYVKDGNNNTLRLLKTNPHGVFATYSPLPPGEYILELKDPNEGYFFDTMKIHIESENPIPFEIYSKEIL